ncbi:hypothetical protein [Candidatus Nitrospira bockiana]
MGQSKDVGREVKDLRQAGEALLELLCSGQPLTADQEKSIAGTITSLEAAYSLWLRRQPVKEQSFQPTSRE